MDSGLKFPKNRSKAAVVEVAVEAMMVLRAVEATREKAVADSAADLAAMPDLVAKAVD